MKKLVGAFLIGVMIMSETLNGCSSDYREDKKTAAQKLLEEKYNEEFVVYEYSGQKLFNDYYTVNAYPKNNPELLFTASVDSDNKSLSDTFVSRNVCQKLADRVSRNLDDVSGYVYVSAETQMDEVITDDQDISVEDFINQNPGNDFIVYVIVVPDEKNPDNLYGKITGMFKNIEMASGGVHLYVCDEELMGKAHQYDLDNAKKFDDYEKMMEGNEVFYRFFSNGTIDISSNEFADMLRKEL